MRATGKTTTTITTTSTTTTTNNTTTMMASQMRRRIVMMMMMMMMIFVSFSSFRPLGRTLRRLSYGRWALAPPQGSVVHVDVGVRVPSIGVRKRGHVRDTGTFGAVVTTVGRDGQTRQLGGGKRHGLGDAVRRSARNARRRIRPI